MYEGMITLFSQISRRFLPTVVVQQALGFSAVGHFAVGQFAVKKTEPSQPTLT